jgi:hypothetical protein
MNCPDDARSLARRLTAPQRRVLRAVGKRARRHAREVRPPSKHAAPRLAAKRNCFVPLPVRRHPDRAAKSPGTGPTWHGGPLFAKGERGAVFFCAPLDRRRYDSPMKSIDLATITALEPFVQPGSTETVLVQSHGKTIAAVVPVTSDDDLEDLILSRSEPFEAILNRSEQRLTNEGGLTANEVRERLGL